MTNKKLVVDFARRKLHMLNKHDILKIKFIRDNPLIHQSYRNEFSNQIHNYHMNCHSSRIMNRCTLTGRARAVIRLVRLNRISFKDRAENGKLVGINKRTW